MIARAQIRNIAKGVERKAVAAYMNAEKHDASNRVAAEVILADEQRYDGALLQWARAFMARMSK